MDVHHFCSIIFCSAAHHRDLHSFPTRRSSDLHPAAPQRPPGGPAPAGAAAGPTRYRGGPPGRDRKSTRLNSSHVAISYAVFCLKKKKYENELVRYIMVTLDIINHYISVEKNVH